MPVTLDDLRRFAVARSFFPPTTLKRALDKLGFVQADPIRAPARAQDLMLRHRVKDYRAGDLERRYAKLGIEEDFFINYGFVTAEIHALMHPRSDHRVPAELSREDLRPRGVPNSTSRLPWSAARGKRAQRLLEFVRERGVVHPQEVDQHFSHGTVKNYWGGKSNATTHLLDEMHYEGLLRVVRRKAGIRLYAARLCSAHEHGPGPADDDARRTRLDALVDVAARIYAPLPGPSLRIVTRRLSYAVPQWQKDLTSALQRAKERLSHAQVDGKDWYWPREEDVLRAPAEETVRLLAPFDPVVWDRARFELLWGWEYRFEAYTPRLKRVRGYYALPLLWRDRVIGWANLSVKDGELKSGFGYVESHPPRDRAFQRELRAELDRLRVFLAVGA